MTGAKDYLGLFISKHTGPPAPEHREEFTAIHLNNLHILFDDPTHMPEDRVINEAINNFKSMIADPKNIKDDTYMIIVGDVKKTGSQVRWQRDIREKLTQPDEYYKKKRARDDRHRVHRKKREIEAIVSDKAHCRHGESATA